MGIRKIAFQKALWGIRKICATKYSGIKNLEVKIIILIEIKDSLGNSFIEYLQNIHQYSRIFQ